MLNLLKLTATSHRIVCGVRVTGWGRQHGLFTVLLGRGKDGKFPCVTIKRGFSKSTISESIAAIRVPIIVTTGLSTFFFAGAMIMEKEMAGWASGNTLKIESRQIENFVYLKRMKSWWNGLSDSQRVVCCLFGINGFIWALWKIPFAASFLHRQFQLGGKAKFLPTLFSTFSHAHPLHLLANMGLLWCFMPPMMDTMGMEHVIALFLTGGMFASVVSILCKGLFHSEVKTMGANGAALALFAAYCVLNPDRNLTFLQPELTYNVKDVLKTLLYLELSCLFLTRPGIVDHGAHLGGMAFGYLYVWYGKHYIWEQREYVKAQWQKLKDSLKE